nr:RHS repeat-associated core domain-containing protein [Serratia rubidaea]
MVGATSQDPIGLQGGLNLYQYAPNPYGRVDPLGLTSCSSVKGNNAHNSTNHQKLKDFYGQAEKYGSGGIKSH